MKDSECIQFLQWALPRLHMRWSGFRKVRTQVCKRIGRRMRELHIDSVADYQQYLEKHTGEWELLDSLSHITISRFYRDKAMFAFLEKDVLPVLARQAIDRGQKQLRVWTAGSSMGEEPYTIAIVWRLRLQSQFPELSLEVVASEIDANMIQRAKTARYLYSSIKNLPSDWRDQVFDKRGDLYTLKSEYCDDVRFIEQDVRREQPPGLFELVFCRNLVFTYFELEQQREILASMLNLVQRGGALVIGIHEDLPEESEGLSIWSDKLRIFRKDME